MQVVNVLRLGEFDDKKFIYGATHSWDTTDGYVTMFIQRIEAPGSENTNWLSISSSLSMTGNN
jgi:hypothetical protein